MASKTPSSAGGSQLAGEILDFMKANIAAMKSDSPNRDAAANEEQGMKDIANAIAFGIEKVFTNTFTVGPPSTLANGGGPAVGTVLLSNGIPYKF